jgi:hypothetical protein
VHGDRDNIIVYNPLQIQEVFQQLLHRGERRALLYGVRIRSRQDGGKEPDPNSYGGRPQDYIIVASLVQPVGELRGMGTYGEEPRMRIKGVLAATEEWMASHLLLLGSVTVIYPSPEMQERGVRPDITDTIREQA